MGIVSADEVGRFIVSHLLQSFKGNDIAEKDITDDFYLMKRGIIDSIGLIQLFAAIEERFGIEVDFEDMDTDRPHALRFHLQVHRGTGEIGETGVSTNEALCPGIQEPFSPAPCPVSARENSFRILVPPVTGGIRMGEDVCLGYDLILETEFPERIWMEATLEINMRSTLIAHFGEIEGPAERAGTRGDIDTARRRRLHRSSASSYFPNVVIHRGAVVAAGSVVNEKRSALMTLVQGNPAVPVARRGIPLAGGVRYKEFLKKIKPYRP